MKLGGGIQWKSYISKQDADNLIRTVAKTRHAIGCELVLVDDVVFEDESDKLALKKMLEEYMQSRLFNTISQ